MAKMFNAFETSKTINPIHGLEKVNCRVDPAIATQYDSIDCLKIHIATCLDWDKEKEETEFGGTISRVTTFEERIAKVNANATTLVTQIKESQVKGRNQAFAAILELHRIREFIENGGNIEDYVSRIMLENDACNSLLQFFATASGCEKTARLVNLILSEDGLPIDGYSEFYKHMRKSMTDAEKRKYDKKLTRSVLKDLIMHYLYGGVSTAMLLFGGYKAPMFKKFERTLEALAPGAMDLRKRILATIDSRKTSYSWTRPDGFVVVTKVITNREVSCKVQTKLTDPKDPTVEPKPITFTANFKYNGKDVFYCATLANLIHSLDSYVCAEIKRRMEHDKSKLKELKGYLVSYPESEREITDRTKLVSLNVVDEMLEDDGELLEFISSNERGLLLELVQDCLQFRNAELVTIHDAFKTHINNVGIVRYHYKRMMLEIAQSNLAEELLTEISGRKQTFTKYSDDLPALIQQCDYAIM